MTTNRRAARKIIGKKVEFSKVESFLSIKSLSSYTDKFIQEGFDLSALLDLTENDINELSNNLNLSLKPGEILRLKQLVRSVGNSRVNDFMNGTWQKAGETKTSCISPQGSNISESSNKENKSPVTNSSEVKPVETNEVKLEATDKTRNPSMEADSGLENKHILEAHQIDIKEEQEDMT